MQRGIALRAYLGASYLLTAFAGPLLRKRLEREKEHPKRWREKLGENLAQRPKGRLVWLHAVGLGEVLSLRGLISRMAALDPNLSFMVTSTTKVSAEVLARQMPPNTFHQFLPIDAPRFRRRFLAHFRPEICVWAEQDLWPGLVSDLAARGIPQCIIAARMNDASYQKHRKAKSLYRDLYNAMAMITAQDAKTAQHFASLGAQAEVTGSLKPAAPALTCDETTLAAMHAALGNRFVWAVAPAHPADMTVAQQAHEAVRQSKPDALLIIAPRFLDVPAGAPWPRRSNGAMPAPTDPIWLFDTFGELGLVYRLAQAALIGGTFSDIEGHNPWEAAALDTAIIHGPHTANFKNDFAQLAQADARFQVTAADDLAKAVLDQSRKQKVANAKGVIAAASQSTDAIATRLLSLVKA